MQKILLVWIRISPFDWNFYFVSFLFLVRAIQLFLVYRKFTFCTDKEETKNLRRTVYVSGVETW